MKNTQSSRKHLESEKKKQKKTQSSQKHLESILEPFWCAMMKVQIPVVSTSTIIWIININEQDKELYVYKFIGFDYFDSYMT